MGLIIAKQKVVFGCESFYAFERMKPPPPLVTPLVLGLAILLIFGWSISNLRGQGAKLCSLKNKTFAKNNSLGFGNSADIWRSSFSNVF